MSAYELQPDGTLKEVDLKRADLVAVVRCRDCRYHVIFETWNPKGEKHHCNSFGQDTDADGFCAWGERR